MPRVVSLEQVSIRGMSIIRNRSSEDAKLRVVYTLYTDDDRIPLDDTVEVSLGPQLQNALNLLWAAGILAVKNKETISETREERRERLGE